MAGNNSSYETSWADQWDPQATYGNYDRDSKTKKNNSNNGSGDGAKKKVEDGLAKTKEVATTGFKKVELGTSLGINWIKDKYHKSTQKN